MVHVCGENAVKTVTFHSIIPRLSTPGTAVGIGVWALVEEKVVAAQATQAVGKVVGKEKALILALGLFIGLFPVRGLVVCGM